MPVPPGSPALPPTPPGVLSVDLSRPQRQSLWAVVFLALSTLRQVGVFQLVLFLGFVLARAPSLPIFLALVGVAGLVLFLAALARWLRYTFAIEGDDVVVRRGVFSQQVLTVPLDRVQSVSLEQKPLHRLVGLVQVELDTAGTDNTEFTIDAVDQPVADALQRAAANHRLRAAPTSAQPVATIPGAAVGPPPPPEKLLHHAPKRVVTVALTEMPFAGLVLLGPLWAFGSQLGDLIPFDLPNVTDTDPGVWLLWVLPLIVVLAFLLSILLNIVRVVLTEWDLTLTSTDAGLRRSAGLLSKQSVAATVPRIQRFRTSQRPLERLADLHTIELQTIGKNNIQLPGCTRDDVDRVRGYVMAGAGQVEDPQQRVSPQAVFLHTRNLALVLLAAGAVLFYLVRWWALGLLLLVPAQSWATRREVRFRRWGVNAEAIVDYRKFFAWQRNEMLLRKVNGVEVRQSLFERKRDLATVYLRSASGDITIGMIPLEHAQLVRDHALRAIAIDTRAWM